MIITLHYDIRTGEVTRNGKKLPILKQASKGPGNEQVILYKEPDLVEYQKFVGLRRLGHGDNEIELQPRREVALKSKVVYTLEEQQELDTLKARIKEIEDAAKSRMPVISKTKSLKAQLEEMSVEQLEWLIEQKRKEIESKKLSLIKEGK